MDPTSMKDYILAAAAIAVVRSLFFTGDFWGLLMAIGIGVALMIFGVPAWTATGIASIGYIGWDLYHKYVEVADAKVARRAKARSGDEARQGARRQLNLVPCLNCGKDISINANRCPVCGFGNEICAICCTRIAPNDVFTLPEGPKKGRNEHHHRSCVDKLFAYDGGKRCRACDQLLATVWVASIVNTALIERMERWELRSRIEEAACPNCGDPRVLGYWDCDCCGLPILSTQEYEIGDDGAWHLPCKKIRLLAAAEYDAGRRS